MSVEISKTLPDGQSAQGSQAWPSARTVIKGLLCLAIPLAFWFVPFPMDPRAKHAIAVASFMILAWITEVLPHAVTGIIGCYLFWVLKVVGFESAFGGFADQTPWFLFGAALIGTMATKSGLARRLAFTVMANVGSGYSRLLLGFILSSFLLTFLVPSGIASLIIMAAVGLGVIEVLGLGRGSNVGRGIFVTLTYTAGCFDKMVVAGAATILGRGLIERGTGIQVYWSIWFLAFLPCVLATIIVMWRTIPWLYPPEKEALGGGATFLARLTGEDGALESRRKEGDVPHANCHRFVGHGLDSPHFPGGNWYWHWSSGRRYPGLGVLNQEEPEAFELPPHILYRRGSQHGRCAGSDQGAQHHDRNHVRLDAAVDHQHIHGRARPLLDGLCLPHLSR